MKENQRNVKLTKIHDSMLEGEKNAIKDISKHNG